MMMLARLQLQRLASKKYSLLTTLVGVATLSICGCDFDVPGLGGGSGALSVACISASVRFVPTPTSIAGGPPTQPALPIDSAACASTASRIGVSWEFLRADVPNSSALVEPLISEESSVFSTTDDDGITYCQLTASLSSEVVHSMGMGRWRVTHNVGSWSVECDDVEVTECPTESHAIAYWISHATMNVNECVQDRLSGGDIIDGNIVEFP
jgi:hypothetical protein